MFKDKIMLAGIAGLIGIVADEFVEWTAFLIKISNSITIHMIGSIIYSSPKLTTSQLIMGEIAHLITGFILGIIPLAFCLWTGKKYPI